MLHCGVAEGERCSVCLSPRVSKRVQKTLDRFENNSYLDKDEVLPLLKFKRRDYDLIIFNQKAGLIRASLWKSKHAQSIS